MYATTTKHAWERKALALVLTAVMLFGLLSIAAPFTAYAAATETAGDADELKAAIAGVDDGGTITLTSDITYTLTIMAYDKSFTINLNGKTLTITPGGVIVGYLGGIDIKRGTLTVQGPGTLDVTGMYVGINAENGSFLVNGGAIVNARASSMTMETYGVRARFSAVVTVPGDVTAVGDAVHAEGDAAVSVTGNVTAAYGDGVDAIGSNVTVGGNVTSTYGNGVVAYIDGGVMVGGDVKAGDDSWGAYANRHGEITIDGRISAGKYIGIGTVEKNASETTMPSTKCGYLFYTDNSKINCVWVKDKTYTGLGTVTVNDSHAGTSGSGSYAVGERVTINAGSRSNYSFSGWTVNSGGVTLADASNASTSFTMPANAVEVTANWLSSDAAVPAVTSVTVSPSTVEVQKGTARQFSATVSGTNNPAQAVTWSLPIGYSGNSSISTNGLLSVAADETEAALTVRATSTLDNTKYGEATVTVASTPPPPVSYLVVTTFGDWQGNGSARAKIDGDYTKFVHLLKDGSIVNADNYTVTAGSTVITLKESYLKTLETGKHTFTVEFSDGKTGNILLNVKAGGGANAQNPDTGVPQTGDRSSVALWNLLFIASLLGVACLIFRRKRSIG